MSAVYDKLADLLVGRFALDRSEIRPDATFEDLKLDSLFVVELMLVIQSDFGVRLADDAASPTDTLSHLVELIENEQVATS